MYSILFFAILLLSIILIRLLKPTLNNIFALFLTLAIIYLILNPTLCIAAAMDGAKLFVKSILPTMFPFMVICNMIINLNGIQMYSKILGPLICKPLKLSYPCSFALVASFLCGYPLGSKYATDLYKNKLISYNEFIRLLNIASNIGPLFLIGAVGTTMLGNTKSGYLLLIPSYLSCIIIGILTINKKEEKFSPLIKHNLPLENKNIGEVIKNSIQDAANNILVLCGYVIIFSVVISMVKNVFLTESIILFICEKLNISTSLITGLLLGSIEATNGCFIISSSNLTILTKLCLISFLCSFGGLSIIAQTTSFFYMEKVPMKKYFGYKFLQGIISMILMFFTYTFFKDSIATSVLISGNYLYISPIIILLTLTLFLLILYRLVLTS